MRELVAGNVGGFARTFQSRLNSSGGWGRATRAFLVLLISAVSLLALAQESPQTGDSSSQASPSQSEKLNLSPGRIRSWELQTQMNASVPSGARPLRIGIGLGQARTILPGSQSTFTYLNTAWICASSTQEGDSSIRYSASSTTNLIARYTAYIPREITQTHGVNLNRYSRGYPTVARSVRQGTLTFTFHHDQQSQAREVSIQNRYGSATASAGSVSDDYPLGSTSLSSYANYHTGIILVDKLRFIQSLDPLGIPELGENEFVFKELEDGVKLEVPFGCRVVYSPAAFLYSPFWDGLRWYALRMDVQSTFGVYACPATCLGIC